MSNKFYTKRKGDKTFWLDTPGELGLHLFSFDKKNIYNLFKDYPWALSKEEKEVFDKENPFWADFFNDRK